MTWTVTAKGWFLACPIYLTDPNQGDICPIPRSKWLNFWFDCNLALQMGINHLLALMAPRYCGFVFWGVRGIEPFKITS